MFWKRGVVVSKMRVPSGQGWAWKSLAGEEMNWMNGESGHNGAAGEQQRAEEQQQHVQLMGPDGTVADATRISCSASERRQESKWCRTGKRFCVQGWSSQMFVKSTVCVSVPTVIRRLSSIDSSRVGACWCSQIVFGREGRHVLKERQADGLEREVSRCYNVTTKCRHTFWQK